MRAAKSLISSVAVALAVSGTPISAQTVPVVDVAAIRAACVSAAACKTAVARAIAAIKAAGLPPAAANTALGTLAATVVEVAQAADAPIETTDVVDMLTDIQTESTDAAQQQSFTEVIADVQNTGVDSIDTGTAFGSSEAG